MLIKMRSISHISLSFLRFPYDTILLYMPFVLTIFIFHQLLFSYPHFHIIIILLFFCWLNYLILDVTVKFNGLNMTWNVSQNHFLLLPKMCSWIWYLKNQIFKLNKTYWFFLYYSEIQISLSFVLWGFLASVWILQIFLYYLYFMEVGHHICLGLCFCCCSK
jgi:hypothetical protein